MSAILYQEQNEGGLHLLTYKERRLAPDYIDSLRSFDECKLVRIMQGSGVWEINGDFYPFRRNDLFLFSRLDYRRIRSVGSAARIEQVTFIPAAVFPYQRCTGLFFTWPSGFSNRLPEGPGSAGDQKLLCGNAPRRARFRPLSGGMYSKSAFQNGDSGRDVRSSGRSCCACRR